MAWLRAQASNICTLKEGPSHESTLISKKDVCTEQQGRHNNCPYVFMYRYMKTTHIYQFLENSCHWN